MYGVWLLPAVLGALVIRKPGAAIYTELVAAVVSALLGIAWGCQVVVYGLVEGAAAELVFAFALYRSWRLPTALLAGAVAGLAAALLDIVFYYARLVGRLAADLRRLLAGQLGGHRRRSASWLLVRALARTGVLAPFASGARPGAGLTASVDADAPLPRRVW